MGREVGDVDERSGLAQLEEELAAALAEARGHGLADPVCDRVSHVPGWLGAPHAEPMERAQKRSARAQRREPLEVKHDPERPLGDHAVEVLGGPDDPKLL